MYIYLNEDHSISYVSEKREEKKNHERVKVESFPNDWQNYFYIKNKFISNEEYFESQIDSKENLKIQRQKSMENFTISYNGKKFSFNTLSQFQFVARAFLLDEGGSFEWDTANKERVTLSKADAKNIIEKSASLIQKIHLEYKKIL